MYGDRVGIDRRKLENGEGPDKPDRDRAALNKTGATRQVRHNPTIPSHFIQEGRKPRSGPV